jgi:hypothetical protein
VGTPEVITALINGRPPKSAAWASCSVTYASGTPPNNVRLATVPTTVKVSPETVKCPPMGMESPLSTTASPLARTP